jgi:anti-sigma factor RsiW
MNVDHQSAVDRNLTERYVLGELETAEADEFEEHFFDCAACADDVRRASILAANLKAVLLDESALPTIRVGPGDKFIDLTIELRAEVFSVECEVRSGLDRSPIVVAGSASGGAFHLHLPTSAFAAGPCTVILRDKRSHQELERREFVVAKTLE